MAGLAIVEVLGILVLCISTIIICLSAYHRYQIINRRAARRRAILLAVRARAAQHMAVPTSGEPLPDHVVVNLLRNTFHDDESAPEDRTCAICLGEYEEGVQVLCLPCKHVFHSDCVGAWFEAHSTCPVCRLSLLPDASASAVETSEAGPDEVVLIMSHHSEGVPVLRERLEEEDGEEGELQSSTEHQLQSTSSEQHQLCLSDTREASLQCSHAEESESIETRGSCPQEQGEPSGEGSRSSSALDQTGAAPEFGEASVDCSMLSHSKNQAAEHTSCSSTLRSNGSIQS